ITYSSTSIIYALSLHDALPFFARLRADEERRDRVRQGRRLDPDPVRQPEALPRPAPPRGPDLSALSRRPDAHGRSGDGCELAARSEEHTSELQSRENLVCRLLL